MYPKIILFLLFLFSFLTLQAESLYDSFVPNQLNPFGNIRPVSYWDGGAVNFNFPQRNSFLVESNAVNPKPESSPALNKNQIERRRSFLEWHQLTGFATWGLWLATNLAGEKAKDSYKKEYEPIANVVLLANPNQNALLYYGIMQVSPYDSKGGATHGSLAGATFLMYSITAGLAFFSPSKLQSDREEGWTTIFTHKAAIFVHLPSMLALASLGSQVQKGGPHVINEMQTIGWVGFGALSLSIATFYF